MPDKKYLIEIPDMPDSSGVWDADKWERNKDKFMQKYPTANVFELGSYDPEDMDDNDQFMLTFNDDPDASGVWDAAKWERNKDKFLAKYPEAHVNRVRYMDYWGDKAKSDQARIAELQQPDEERNARLAEMGYYDDSAGTRVDYANALGLSPLSSAVKTNSVSGEVTYLDPRVEEFFADDSAYTDRQMELNRLRDEYEANPRVIEQREYEAQMARYAEELEKQIKADMEADVDAYHAGRGAAAKHMQDASGANQTIQAIRMLKGEDVGKDVTENEKQERYASALKLLQQAKDARDVAGKGMAGGVADTAKDWLRNLGTQSDIEMYNEVGNILTALEQKVGNLNEVSDEVIEENLTNDEKALIRAFFEYNAAMADAGEDMSIWYKGGKIFAESIPFMMEFLVTGGLANSAGRAATSWMGKGFAKWIANSAKGTAARAAKKVAAKTVSGVAKTIVAAGARTLVAPTTYKNIAEQSVQYGEDGHLDRDGNMVKAAVDSYIEQLSEMSGAAFGEVLGGVGRLALGKTAFEKVGAWFGNNAVMQNLSKLGFHGLPEEVGEEIFGNALRTITGVDEEALSRMFEKDEFASMIIGFAPMTLLGAGMSMAKMGAVSIGAANAGRRMRQDLSRSYTEKQIDQVEMALDEAKDANEIANAIRPIIMGMQAAGAPLHEVQSVWDYAIAVAKRKAMVSAQSTQEMQLAQAKIDEAQERMGGRFWIENKDGVKSVKQVVLNNGNTAYVVSEPDQDGRVAIINAVTGQKGTALPGDIKEESWNGTLNAFGTGLVMADRTQREQQRMQEERTAQVNEVRNRLGADPRINIGTEGSPIYVVAQSFNDAGVRYVAQDGSVGNMSWEQAADSIGMPIVVKTDAQIAQEEAEALVAAAAERRAKRAKRDAVGATERDNAVVDAENAVEGANEAAKHIPMNEDGTVNEAAFWEQSPEEYVKWNDEQNQDGGQDSLQQVAIAKQELMGLLQEANAAQNTSNPTTRKAAKKEVERLADRIARLDAIEQSYAQALEEEQAAVRQTAAAPTSSMSEEDLESMDAQYQGILGKTRVQGERVRVMQEYLDKISEESTPAIVLTRENYVKVMEQEGCPEYLIDAVRDQVEAGEHVEGFMAAGKVFLMADGLGSIEDSRITYIHERQHTFNRTNPQLVKRVANALESKEKAIAILKSFVGERALRAYKNLPIEGLADEIVAFSMEVVYSNEEFSVDLQSRGIPSEVISIITEIDNEQRQDQRLSHARRRSRRNSHEDALRAGSARQDGGNLEQVSGGVLGEETARPSEAGEGGAQIGEGAEVISEEQLLVESGLIESQDIRFRITPEQDKAYMDAVEAGDMETAQRMVVEAARLAMPNTKVVDENGNPKVVYHGSTAMFTIFDKSRIGSATGTADGRGFYFTTDRDYALGYKTPDGQLFEVFLNIEKPLSYDKKTITKAQLRKILKEADRVEYEQEGEHYMLSNYANYNDVGIDGAVNEGANLEYDYADNDVELVGSLIGGSGSFDLIMDAVKKVTGKSGMIAPKDNGTIHYVVTDPAGIKSAEPVTYDDDGNVIPLSERFNKENPDIRFRVRSEEEREKLFEDAKKHYGVTQNFKVAGYMLPDGSLLDFSEANDGGDPNSRSLDHRDIEGVIMDNGVEYDSRWMYIADFMNEGAIRLLPESAGINMIQAPTEEQRKKIFDFIYKYNGEVILEINDERLNSVAYMEYDRRTSPSRIFRDIDGYFNNGIVPQQDIRFRFIGKMGAANLDKAEEATIRLDNLAVAKKMEKAGKDARDIKFATGWERGADRLWRYEEPDFWIDGQGEDYLDQPTERKSLSEYVDKYDWEYFVKAYPELSDLQIEITEFDGYGGGYYDPFEHLIVLRPSNGYEFNKGAIMHEVQHAIQEVEGFASGTNPEMFADAWLYGLNTDTLLHALRIREQAEAEVAVGRYKRIGNAINHAAKVYDYLAGESVDKEESVEVAKYRDSNELYKFIVSGKKDAERKYLRTAGEVEARNVEERYKRGWGNGEYLYHLAEETEDVARKDQIFLEDALTAAMPSDVRFRMSNNNQAIFVSNAARAVEGIKQEKATPEQWLKMLEKAGGLKAGEDKWLGLSDWLNASDKKTLTKQEVLDFINENMIIIEEQHYSEDENALDGKRQEIQEALQGIFDEYVAESEDMNDDMFMKTHYDYAIQKLADELGYTAFNAPFVNNNAVVELDFYEDDLDTLHELSNRLGLEKYDGTRDINDTRLYYTTEGLTDRHEIALTVPTIEPWNERDDVHFGDAGDGRAIAWIRFGETEVPVQDAAYTRLQEIYDRLSELEMKVSSTGISHEEYEERARLREERNELQEIETRNHKVLVIDEIQSNRHQEGREKGYLSKDAVENRKKARDRAKKASNALYDYIGELVSKYPGTEYSLERVRENRGRFTEEENTKLTLLIMESNNAELDLEKSRTDAIPDAPFDKNWHELAMKRMLRYAAENGYDVIAWTTGDQQASRYNLSKMVKKISVYPSKDGSRIVDLHLVDRENDFKNLVVDSEGMVTFGEYKGRALADVVGKDYSMKIMAATRNTEFSGDNLQVGGEGMRGFYDKMLPAFMNKYGKKWGVKVEDIDLPNLGRYGYTMHSVPVTEEMKASVMEGQVMFRVRGENESAEEFVNGVIEDFRSRYTAFNDIVVLDPTSKEQLADFIGMPVDKLSDEMMADLMDRIEERDSRAWFNPDTKRIAIFVRENVRDGKKSELVLIHENIHAINKKHNELIAIGEYLWNSAKEGTREHRYKTAITEAYPESEWFDEMSAYVVSEYIQDGEIDVLKGLLDAESTELLDKLLKYNGNGKERARQRPRISWNVLRERPSDKSEESRDEGGEGQSGDLRFRATEITPEVRDEMDVIAATAIVNGNYMKAPNGADTNLTPEQWAMVRTKNFREWFGDWENDPGNASKVVDENGEPKVVFHGGAWRPLLEEKGNAVFKMRGGLMGKGAYFTDMLSTAIDYAREKYGWEHDEEVSDEFLDDNGYITEVFLNIRNEDNIRVYYGETYYLATNPSQIKSATGNTGEFADGEGDIRFSIRTKPAPEKTGVGYKVFYLKDGKLYPPMVANQGGVDTPVGVWLDAEEGTRAGESKTGRPQVKQGGKGTQGGSGKLAYRPGWHLGEIPYALQFNRKDESGEKTLFPADFVWAEVEYANDVDYQEEAMSYGYNANGKFQHSLAGLPKLPTDGSYRYRTNPNPETDPWIITGAMKVNRLLTPSEVDQMVIDAGREPQKRQEGAVTDAQIEALNKELGLEETVSFRFSSSTADEIDIKAMRGISTLRAFNVSFSEMRKIFYDVAEETEKAIMQLRAKQNRTAYENEKLAREEKELRAIHRRIDWWESVNSQLVSTDTEPTVLKDGDFDLEPRTPAEFISKFLTMSMTRVNKQFIDKEGKAGIKKVNKRAGVMLTQDTLRRELGWNEKDWSGFRYILSESEGKSLDEIAEMISEDSDAQSIFVGMDVMDIKNEIIDFLQSVRSYADIRDYIKNERIREAKEERDYLDGLVEATIEQIESSTGMTIDEYNDRIITEELKDIEKILRDVETSEIYGKFEDLTDQENEAYQRSLLEGAEGGIQEGDQAVPDLGDGAMDSAAAENSEPQGDSRGADTGDVGDRADESGGSRIPPIGNKRKGLVQEPMELSSESAPVDEVVNKGRQKAINENVQANDIFSEKVQRLNNSLAKLRSALAAQREYDVNTVKIITALANELLQIGRLTDMSRSQIKRLLSVIKDATGKEDLSIAVERLMDIMIDNQLRSGKSKISGLTKIKASKVNASGVEVRGFLDVAGQQMLQTFKDSIAPTMTDETLAENISIEESNLDSDSDVIRKNAENRLVGYYLAQQYRENILASEAEEKSIREEIKRAKEQHDAGLIDKDANKEFVKSCYDAIRENRMERVTAYEKLANQLAAKLAGSILNAKLLKDAEKARIEQIHHFANSDMQGMPSVQQGKVKKGIWNNTILRFLFKPLATFDQMLRSFAPKSRNGEGYLWNHFMGGWLRSSENEFKGIQAAHEQLDVKVRSMFAGAKRWSDLFSIEKKLPTMEVKFWDGEKMADFALTQGNLLYIYMVNKMTDGKMKLRKMGITEEDVNNIARELDPRFIELADWIQDTFLPGLREKYNTLHEKMFGAPMAAIDNYFPIRVLANARTREVDIAVEESSARPSTITGSIIKRTKNSLALDILGSDAFDVVLEHIEQMEHWAAFAEFNRDLNTLLSYRKFRNRVQNMRGIYGAGTTAWNNFRSVAEIAAGVYKPAVKGDSLDKLITNIAKGVTGAKISFRVYTALKQFLSAPAFVSDASAAALIKSLANPYKAWTWAMKELPLFEKRWKSRQAGDSRLMETESDWKLWKNKIVEFAGRYGMTPNAFVDALTVSIGARAIYETKRKEYVKLGYTQDQAEEKAKRDATVLYNESQQSNESAFLSAAQVDRTVASVLITVFRNSSMGYQRMYVDALRNIKHMLKKGYKAESLEYMKKQMMRDGLTEDQAERAANRIYNKSFARSATRLATFGFLVQFAWNLGPYMAYLLMGDDDDEKKDMIKDAAVRGLVGGPVEGLAAGQAISGVLGDFVMSEEISDPMLKLPATSDMESIFRQLEVDPVRAVNDIFNLVIQSGIGVNPQTITDAVVAIIDGCNGDLETSKEAAFALMRILQTPQSQIEKLYMEEIDFTAEEALDMSVREFAERYAKYKVMRTAPLTKWMYSDEKEKELEDKYIKTFTKKASEMERTHGTEEAQEFFEYYDSEYEETAETLRDLKKQLKEAILDSDTERESKANEDLDNFLESEEFKRFEELLPHIKAYEAYRKALKTIDDPKMRSEYAEKMIQERNAAVEKLRGE